MMDWCKTRTGLGICLFLAVELLSGGCAHTPLPDTALSMDEWRVRAEDSKGVSVTIEREPLRLPEIPEDAPEQGAQDPNRPLPNHPVSIRLHQVSLQVCLSAVGRLADLIVHFRSSDAEETESALVEVRADELPWDELFRSILKTHHLDYRWEGASIIRVISLEDMKQDLALEEFHRQEEATKARWELDDQPLLTRTIPLHYLTFADESEAENFRKNLEQLLTERENPEGSVSRGDSDKQYGSVSVDTERLLVIVHGIPRDIEQVYDLVTQMDRPTRQLLIRASIVETTQDTARELGIQWGGLLKMGNNWITAGSNENEILGQSLQQAVDPVPGMGSNFPANLGLDANPSGMVMGLVSEEVGKYLLDVQLSALQKEGKLNIISRPSITTTEGRTALIESGREVPYQIVTGTGDLRETTTEWKKAVLKLEVTPQVVAGEMVRLDISASKDELDFTRTTESNPNPIVITKNASTYLTLENGQTTVIGGLRKEKTNVSDSGVPGLKDLPFFGWLFRKRGNGTDMEEIFIFITPYIL